jgi:hypothetical protein
MGSTTTTILPIANVVALVAAFLTSVSAYWCRTSKSSRIFGTIAAGTGTLFVFIGFLFDIIFIATSSGLKGAGVGFWLTGIAFVVLLIFVIAAVCYGRTPKEEEKIEQPENQVQQPIDPRADPYYYGNNGPGMQGNINPADLLAFLRNQGGETGPGKDAMLQAPGKIETPKKSGKWW